LPPPFSPSERKCEIDAAGIWLLLVVVVVNDGRVRQNDSEFVIKCRKKRFHVDKFLFITAADED
jgi:hypothetical protein